MLIEENGARILTDPGNYTEAQNDVKNIDVLLITHEHGDHFHIESVKKILENNPNVPIVTNSSVDMLLKKDGITHATIIEDGQSAEVKGLKFAGHGTAHALIHGEWPSVQNTGYMIGERLFYPGDSLEHSGIDVDILALPVAGPWIKISEAIDYCIKLVPRMCFPVHDGMLNQNGGGVINRVVPQILEKHNIKFTTLETGKETEL